MGKIHELFVLALSLVWFAGATPEYWGFGPNLRVPYRIVPLVYLDSLKLN